MEMIYWCVFFFSFPACFQWKWSFCPCHIPHSLTLLLRSCLCNKSVLGKTSLLCQERTFWSQFRTEKLVIYVGTKKFVQESKEERWNTWRGKSDTRAKGEKKKKNSHLNPFFSQFVGQSFRTYISLWSTWIFCKQRWEMKEQIPHGGLTISFMTLHAYQKECSFVLQVHACCSFHA